MPTQPAPEQSGDPNSAIVALGSDSSSYLLAPVEQTDTPVNPARSPPETPQLRRQRELLEPLQREPR